MTERAIADEKINRYFASRWSLVECAAILEPVSMRTLTSWVSGQTLEIKPRVWTAQEIGLKAEEVAVVAANTSMKPRKRARYGFPNLLQFVTARTLFAEGIERVMVQHFVDIIASPDRTLALGYFLILTGSSPQEGFFFPDKEKLVAAIVSNNSPLPQCSVFNFDSVLKETIRRLDAWERRRQYVAESQENTVSDARREWIAAGAERIMQQWQKANK